MPPVIDPETIKHMWRVSPAATAVTLSRDSPRPFMPYKHSLYISKAIREAVMGMGPRYLIINLPPQLGKSTIGSYWTPLWFLENWPHKKVMMTGYGTSFAAEFGAMVRNTVEANKGTLSFSLAEDSKAKDQWRTNMGGSMVSAGVGGQITGKGADLLIIDDPLKNSQEAMSITHRDKIWQWWATTASSRLSKNGVVLVILTRWHIDDLAGRLLSEEFNPEYCNKFKKIVLPALCDSEDDPLGRKIGESICPELFSEEAFRFKMAMAGDEAMALYQQKPRGEDGSGNVYDHYSDIENVMRVERDPKLELDWCLDFNRDPFCTIVAQHREWLTPTSYLTNEKLLQVEVLQEIIEHDIGTEEMCRVFVERTRVYVNRGFGPVKLNIFGDTSGNKRSTSADRTDWQIIRQFFKRYPEYQVRYFLGSNNPPVKSRVNAMNGALMSFDGFRRVKVDPSCVELRKDFKNVRWAVDSNGNTMQDIDKRDRKRTHTSDALGYMIWSWLGLREESGEMSGLMQ